MKVYISGQITGLDYKVASEHFNAVADKLREAGHEAVNPIDICPAPAGDCTDWSWEQCMVKDIEALLSCNAIFMLGNWRDSRGARIEHYISSETNKKIYYAQNHDLF